MQACVLPEGFCNAEKQPTGDVICLIREHMSTGDRNVFVTRSTKTPLAA
jgi:hypothetical protein